jgi:hypothetical protein
MGLIPPVPTLGAASKVSLTRLGLCTQGLLDGKHERWGRQPVNSGVGASHKISEAPPLPQRF